VFHAFRGELDALDNAPGPKSTERLEWDVRKGLSTLKSHPWIPTEGPDAITRYAVVVLCLAVCHHTCQ
jgi:carbonic anhydrase